MPTGILDPWSFPPGALGSHALSPFSRHSHFLRQRMWLGRRRRRPVILRPVSTANLALEAPLPIPTSLLLRPHTDSYSGTLGGASPRKSSLTVLPSYLHSFYILSSPREVGLGEGVELKALLLLAAASQPRRVVPPTRLSARSVLALVTLLFAPSFVC